MYLWRSLALVLIAGLAGACASTPPAGTSAGGYYKVGAPYQINGIWYYPQEDPLYDETGIASWYGDAFAGRKTANGEIFDPRRVTAAHKTLPMPSLATVTNLENGKTLVVRVNDRGPFKPGRIIDLSERAAELLGLRDKGLARVRVTYSGRAALDGKPAGPAPKPGAPSRVSAAPSPEVRASSLAPPPGVTAAPAAEAAPLPEPEAAPAPSSVQEGAESRVPVSGGERIYVQAGAFTTRANAQRLLDRLRGAGAFRIDTVSRGGKTFYVVRAGPLASVEEADGVLAAALSAGQKDAQIVVE